MVTFFRQTYSSLSSHRGLNLNLHSEARNTNKIGIRLIECNSTQFNKWQPFTLIACNTSCILVLFFLTVCLMNSVVIPRKLLMFLFF